MDHGVVVGAENVDYAPFLVSFTCGAQNRPPPRLPLLGWRISGCFATTDRPKRKGWAWFATELSPELAISGSSDFVTM